MLLISEHVEDNYGVEIFKAPPGKQFHVKRINSVHVGSPGGNTILMFDREIDAVGDHDNPVWVGQGSSNGAFSFEVDFKTKYISISEDASSGLDVWIQVYGDYIELTKIEAIWEFLTKKIHR